MVNWMNAGLLSNLIVPSAARGSAWSVTLAISEAARVGVEALATKHTAYQTSLFEPITPERVEVNLHSLRVERTACFGGVWLGKRLLEMLGLDNFFAEHIPHGREDIHWSILAQILILGRFLDPSNELHLAEHLYARTAMAEIFGVLAEKINDDRLYRALDAFQNHKAALTEHLMRKGGELFGLTYDMVLYDVTSISFEGTAAKSSSAQRGYSRDHRPDCLQLCIALVVDHSGLPLGYNVFPAIVMTPLR